jgi:hypothetical protein
MEFPTDEQIAAAFIESRRRGETAEEFEARLDSLVRMSDEDLAAMGIAVAEVTSAPALPAAFEPVPVRRRHDGWTADKQRDFIAALAETGCVSEACAEVGITPRSAYRLREHPKGAAFRAAWDHAQSLACVRLTALAWERAVHGSTERLYKDGELVAERRRPSDRLLMWLLAHYDAGTFGWASRPPGDAPDISFFKLPHARRELPGLIGELKDVERSECPAERLVAGDHYDEGEAVPRA